MGGVCNSATLRTAHGVYTKLAFQSMMDIIIIIIIEMPDDMQSKINFFTQKCSAINWSRWHTQLEC